MKFLLNITGVLLATVLLSIAVSARAGSEQVSGRYVNDIGPHKMNFGKAASQVVFSRQVDKSPSEPLPLRHMDAASLAGVSGPVIYRLGHSSILIKLGDDLVLVDPVFSKRASPLQWVGPKRFHPVPLAPEALPEITAVVISHNHYDHLDKGTVRQLADNVQYFLVPLGVGKHLRDWGVAEESIVEMDWWEELEIGDLTFAATPACLLYTSDAADD